MTKDKTVTMSRELIERIASGMWYADSRKSLTAEIEKILAAPIVEADGMGEAVAWATLQEGWKDEDRTVITDPVEAEQYNRQCYELTPLYASQHAPVAVMLPEPMPITEGMDRLMEAYRLGEFRLEGGSPTVEAMSCKSFDEKADAVRDHDFDSYAAGYQAAMYEEASSLLGHIACLDKVKELNK